MEKVKCADCGFVAIRHMQSRLLEEVEDSTRELGVVPSEFLQLVQRKHNLPSL